MTAGYKPTGVSLVKDGYAVTLGVNARVQLTWHISLKGATTTYDLPPRDSYHDFEMR